jgi:hypothetical protein
MDQFTTRNEYHGGLIGLLGQLRCRCFTFQGLAKIALGNMRQTVTIDGQTVIDDGVTVVTDPNGLLARWTNIGTYRRDEFAVVPEVGLTMSYAFCRGVDLTVGYSLIVWSDVVQPGDQIDPELAVNLSQPPTGAQRPAFQFDSTEYWVRGLTLGLSCRY